MAVVMETTLGDLTVDLFVEQRPQACLNFLKLCKMKYYNYSLFHSVQSGFLAQAGDPTGSGSGGESIWGILEGKEKRYFTAERVPKIRHSDAGMLSMVCAGESLIGSQFFFTLGANLDSLDALHCVIGIVTEGHDVLRKLNEVICDDTHRPYRDVRVTHTVILEDPFNDPPRLCPPERSPSPSAERLAGGRIAPDEEIDEAQGKTIDELSEMIEEKEAKARATILEIVGDLPDADVAPPENVLFVCKLNPVTTDSDLEIIFSRFGKIVNCEVIRDKKTGDSLQYAFIEFEDQKSCESAYFKMDNVLIDDRRIHVDFSQSVSKIKWLGKGRGVKHVNERVLDIKKTVDRPRRRTRSREMDRKQIRRSRSRNRDDRHRRRSKSRGKEDRPRRQSRSRDRDRQSRRERDHQKKESDTGHGYRKNRKSKSRSPIARKPSKDQSFKNSSASSSNHDRREMNQTRSNQKKETLEQSKQEIEYHSKEKKTSNQGRQCGNSGISRNENLNFKDAELIKQDKNKTVKDNQSLEYPLKKQIAKIERNHSESESLKELGKDKEPFVRYRKDTVENSSENSEKEDGARNKKDKESLNHSRWDVSLSCSPKYEQDNSDREKCKQSEHNITSHTNCDYEKSESQREQDSSDKHNFSELQRKPKLSQDVPSEEIKTMLPLKYSTDKSKGPVRTLDTSTRDVRDVSITDDIAQFIHHGKELKIDNSQNDNIDHKRGGSKSSDRSRMRSGYLADQGEEPDSLKRDEVTRRHQRREKETCHKFIEERETRRESELYDNPRAEKESSEHSRRKFDYQEKRSEHSIGMGYSHQSSKDRTFPSSRWDTEMGDNEQSKRDLNYTEHSKGQTEFPRSRWNDEYVDNARDTTLHSPRDPKYGDNQRRERDPIDYARRDPDYFENSTRERGREEESMGHSRRELDYVKNLREDGISIAHPRRGTEYSEHSRGEMLPTEHSRRDLEYYRNAKESVSIERLRREMEYSDDSRVEKVTSDYPRRDLQYSHESRDERVPIEHSRRYYEHLSNERVEIRPTEHTRNDMQFYENSRGGIQYSEKHRSYQSFDQSQIHRSPPDQLRPETSDDYFNTREEAFIKDSRLIDPSRKHTRERIPSDHCRREIEYFDNSNHNKNGSEQRTDKKDNVASDHSRREKKEKRKNHRDETSKSRTDKSSDPNFNGHMNLDKEHQKPLNKLEPTNSPKTNKSTIKQTEGKISKHRSSSKVPSQEHSAKTKTSSQLKEDTKSQTKREDKSKKVVNKDKKIVKKKRKTSTSSSSGSSDESSSSSSESSSSESDQNKKSVKVKRRKRKASTSSSSNTDSTSSSSSSSDSTSSSSSSDSGESSRRRKKKKVVNKKKELSKSKIKKKSK